LDPGRYGGDWRRGLHLLYQRGSW